MTKHQFRNIRNRRQMEARSTGQARFEKHPGPSACRGQAHAETALFSFLAFVLVFGILSLIPIHRARTAATAASYACAQCLSQSPQPARAASNAHQIARKTLDADWSATLGVEYRVEVVPPAGPGEPGGCAVHYLPPMWFTNILGLQETDWPSEWFVSRSETWKAKWQ